MGSPNATDPKTNRPAHGFDVHAARRISTQNRKELERMCRYILRPPFAHDRLTRLDDGRVLLRLKRSWSDGTTHLIHDANDFIARLVPLIAPPRSHQVRYHGLFASASKHRADVVPEPKPDETIQLRLFAKGKSSAQLLARRIRWAKLVARVFGFDPLRCPRCDRNMRIVAFVTQPGAIAAILSKRNASLEGPRPHGARAPPQLELPFCAYGNSEPRAA